MPTDYTRVIETLTKLGLPPEVIHSNITLAESPSYWKVQEVPTDQGGSDQGDSDEQ